VPTVAYVPALTKHTRPLTSSQINPYMSNPSHVELILTEGAEVVQKSNESVERRLNSRQRGREVRKAITAA
jgi:large subunit ribosomal protein L17e